MEFKVKEVTVGEEKSVQQVEQELLDKHEEGLQDDQPKAEEPKAEAKKEIEITTNDDDTDDEVVKKIEEKIGKKLKPS